jgi:hypothetical protein
MVSIAPGLIGNSLGPFQRAVGPVDDGVLLACADAA